VNDGILETASPKREVHHGMSLQPLRNIVAELILDTTRSNTPHRDTQLLTGDAIDRTPMIIDCLLDEVSLRN
jgi:hypothetical protein